MLSLSFVVGALASLALCTPYIVQLQPNTTFASYLQSHSIDVQAQVAARVQKNIKIGPYEWLVMELENEDSVAIIKDDPLVKTVEPNLQVVLMVDGSQEDIDEAVYKEIDTDKDEAAEVEIEDVVDYEEEEYNDVFDTADYLKKNENDVDLRDAPKEDQHHSDKAGMVGPESLGNDHDFMFEEDDISTASISEDSGDEVFRIQVEPGSDSPIEAQRPTVQADAPSHLARIITRDGIWDQNEPYQYKQETCGEGVVAYVIDSGTTVQHPEFEGRATWGFSVFPNEDDVDYNGHGTHVGGLIASTSYGVAKCAEVVAIKVMSRSGNGDVSAILQGIEWAVNDRRKRGVKGVINMSLGGFFMTALNDASDAAVGEGMVVVAAAGNSDTSTSFSSPASADKVIAVGAMDEFSDSITSFSDWGEKVAVFAPGWEVESLNSLDFDKPIRLSGTSMASPIVAGVACLLLERGVPVDAMKSTIIGMATEGALAKSLKKWKYYSTLDRLVYIGPPTEQKKVTRQNPNHLLFKTIEVPGQLNFDAEKGFSDF